MSNIAANDDWRTQLKRCFGVTSKQFCMHAIERDHALRLLQLVHDSRVPWEAVEEEARRFMASEGCDPKHIEKEVGHMNNAKTYVEGMAPLALLTLFANTR